MRKHTKKGDKDVDIKPDFENAAIEYVPGGVNLKLRLPLQRGGQHQPGPASGGAEGLQGRGAFFPDHPEKAFEKRFFRISVNNSCFFALCVLKYLSI